LELGGVGEPKEDWNRYELGLGRTDLKPVLFITDMAK
jgi:hypothetical protein